MELVLTTRIKASTAGYEKCMLLTKKIIVSYGLDILIATAPRAYQHPELPTCYSFHNHKST